MILILKNALLKIKNNNKCIETYKRQRLFNSRTFDHKFLFADRVK